MGKQTVSVIGHMGVCQCPCGMTGPWSVWREGAALSIPDLFGAGWWFYWTKELLGNLSQMAGGRLSFTGAFCGWIRFIPVGVLVNGCMGSVTAVAPGLIDWPPSHPCAHGSTCFKVSVLLGKSFYIAQLYWSCLHVNYGTRVILVSQV